MTRSSICSYLCAWQIPLSVSFKQCPTGTREDALAIKWCPCVLLCSFSTRASLLWLSIARAFPLTSFRSHSRVDLLPHSLHARELLPALSESLSAGRLRLSLVPLVSPRFSLHNSVTCEAGYIADRVGSATCDVRSLSRSLCLPRQSTFATVFNLSLGRSPRASLLARLVID